MRKRKRFQGINKCIPSIEYVDTDIRCIILKFYYLIYFPCSCRFYVHESRLNLFITEQNILIIHNLR